MFLDLLFMLLGFVDNVPKHDLHPRKTPFKFNDATIIFILFVGSCIFFMLLFVFVGSCTESGVFYNSNLY